MDGVGWFGSGWFGPGWFGTTSAAVGDVETATFASIGYTVHEPILILVTVEINGVLSDGTDTVVITITGVNTAHPVVGYVGSGVYAATYIPTVIGTDFVAVQVNGVFVPGSPFPLLVQGVPAPGAPLTRRQRFYGPTSAVAIVNMALSHIGVNQTVADLNENSTEARLAVTWYDQCRRYVLAEYPWDFAEQRATLAYSLTAPPLPWGFRYAVPIDMVTPRAIDTGVVIQSSDYRVPFQLIDRTDGTARELVTDQADAVLIYTTDIVTVQMFPPQFVDALAYRLAMQFAEGLSKSQPISDRVARYYLMSIGQAGARSLNAAQKRPEPEASFIQGRG